MCHLLSRIPTIFNKNKFTPLVKMIFVGLIFLLFNREIFFRYYPMMIFEIETGRTYMYVTVSICFVLFFYITFFF